jgi:hypothetical protein
MPAWLLNLLIKLAIDFGLPFLLKKFPWIPGEVKQIIEELLAQIKEANGQKAEVRRVKVEAKREAKRKIREFATVGYATDLKK